MTTAQACAILGLEDPDAFAARIVASPEHREMVENSNPFERHWRGHTQTGKTTKMLLAAALDALDGAVVRVWVLPGHERRIGPRLHSMIWRLGGRADRVWVSWEPPVGHSFAGVDPRQRIALHRDHAVERPWPESLREEMAHRGVVLGERPGPTALLSW